MEMRVVCTSINFYPRSPCGERQESQQPSGHPTTDFYPRSPCGERPELDTLANNSPFISIHALLAESDSSHDFRGRISQRFLSTLSLRRATGVPLFYNNQCQDFYPRSPCGERLKNAEAVSKYMIFLSTLSLRRATRTSASLFFGRFYFYPRSPCGERLANKTPFEKFEDFYPRSPCGERPKSYLLSAVV